MEQAIYSAWLITQGVVKYHNKTMWCMKSPHDIAYRFCYIESVDSKRTKWYPILATEPGIYRILSSVHQVHQAVASPWLYAHLHLMSVSRADMSAASLCLISGWCWRREARIDKLAGTISCSSSPCNKHPGEWFGIPSTSESIWYG